VQDSLTREQSSGILIRSIIITFKKKQHKQTITQNENSKMVKYVESEGEWAALMEQSNEKLIVVDFTASW